MRLCLISTIPRVGKERIYMKKIIILIVKALGCLLGVAALVFGMIQAVYWLNLDNKFMFLLHRILNKITDRVPRDRKF